MQTASPSQLDALGHAAALRIQPHQTVGLGSGKAALAFVRALGKRNAEKNLHLRCVCTSLLTEKTAREANLPLVTLDDVDSLDIAVDGADEVDPRLHLIKGGGGNLLREKVVESLAQHLLIVVGREKIVPALGTSFPVFVEVVEFARTTLLREIARLGAKVTQRMNPDNSPFLTDNGNPYLHCQFSPHSLADPTAINTELRALPGVVETGLFIGMAAEAMVANFDDTIVTLTPQ